MMIKREPELFLLTGRLFAAKNGQPNNGVLLLSIAIRKIEDQRSKMEFDATKRTDDEPACDVHGCLMNKTSASPVSSSVRMPDNLVNIN